MVSATKPAKIGGKGKEAFGFTGFLNLFRSVLVSFPPPQLENLYCVIRLYVSCLFPDWIQRKMVKKRNDKEHE